MIDLRIKKLAKILIEYSLKVKAKQKVLVACSDPVALPLAEEAWKQILLKKAYPYLFLETESLEYFYFKKATFQQLKKKPEIYNFMADWCHKSISLRAMKNKANLANIDFEKLKTRMITIREIKDKFLKKPWVLTYYPTESVAQAASMSLEELEDFYFKACFQDWEKIKNALLKLKETIDDAWKVELVGEKTKLTFSLKNRYSKICAGKMNMPDGEIYAAPLENSVDGEIYFDFPTFWKGEQIRDIKLTFAKGKVVKATASQNQKLLKEVLKTDKGASRLGEFGIGTNYGIKKITNNTLFDEKIGGTIHLALGRAYTEKEGGGKNKSAIHWDIVKDMRKKGSKIIIDGRIILKDGKILESPRHLSQSTKKG